MKWLTNLIYGIAIAIIGFVMVLGANTIEIPGRYKTFLGIPYETNPEFQIALISKLVLFSLGIVAILGGLAIIVISYLRENIREVP